MSGFALGVITDGISPRLDRALEVAAEFNLGQVELQHLWHKPIHLLTRSELDHANRMIRERGMTVSCVTGHAFHGHAIADVYQDPNLLQAEFDKLAACLKAAEILECPLVRVMNFRKEMFLFGGGGAEAWNVKLELWDQFLSVMSAACAMARLAGVRLVVETGLNAMISSGKLGRKLVDDLNDENLAILWDPANCLYYRESPVPAGFDALGVNAIGHVHIKDMRMDIAAAHIEHCALGKGELGAGLDGLARQLRAANYKGSISLESVYRPPGGSFEDGFRDSIGRFTEVFG